MDVLLQIIQISLFVVAGLCYIIKSFIKYQKAKKDIKLKEFEKQKSKELLFEMYKKYFKENQNLEQETKTTTEQINELEQQKG